MLAALSLDEGRTEPHAAVNDLLHAERLAVVHRPPEAGQGCQKAKFDPFLFLDCARVEGVGTQSKERKGSNFAA